MEFLLDNLMVGHSEQASWKQEGPGDGRRDKFVEKNRRNLKAGIREKNCVWPLP